MPGILLYYVQSHVFWQFAILPTNVTHSRMEYVQTVIGALSVLTVIGQLIALAVVAVLPRPHTLLFRWVAAHGLVLMLITACIATAGSLYFSEIAQWTPCRLCWFQRIFMYPQVFLLATALWKKDRGIAPYILVLSVIGLLIAAVHYGEQVSAALFPAEIDPDAPCDTSGTSCRTTPFFRLGYVTIPMMAFTVFLLNALGSLVIIRSRNNHTQ